MEYKIMVRQTCDVSGCVDGVIVEAEPPRTCGSCNGSGEIDRWMSLEELRDILQALN